MPGSTAAPKHLILNAWGQDACRPLPGTAASKEALKRRQEKQLGTAQTKQPRAQNTLR